MMTMNMETKIQKHTSTSTKSKIDADFERVGRDLFDLSTQVEEAIELMMELARESEHPRAFEVLAGMFKTTTDMMDQLITLQKKRKELTQSEGQKPGESGNTTNNAIFVGSTTELQKFLSNNNDNN